MMIRNDHPLFGWKHTLEIGHSFSAALLLDVIISIIWELPDIGWTRLTAGASGPFWRFDDLCQGGKSQSTCAYPAMRTAVRLEWHFSGSTKTIQNLLYHTVFGGMHIHLPFLWEFTYQSFTHSPNLCEQRLVVRLLKDTVDQTWSHHTVEDAVWKARSLWFITYIYTYIYIY